MKKFLPLIIILLLFPTSALAQEAISITAIPPRVQVSSDPGETLQQTLKVRNESDQELQFTVVTQDFVVNNDQGTPIPVTEAVSGRWSLSSWLTTSPDAITLKPKQTEVINLLINVPQDALSGGHYAMISYQTGLPGGNNGSASTITPSVGSLIYLQVNGDITEAINLKQFSVNKFQTYGPVDITAEIENLGDIHLQPIGSLKITDLLNRQVLNQPLKEYNIFPFASRTYSWQLPSKWYLGKYKAELTAMAGESQTPIHGLVYFWVIPYKEISMITGALLLIIVLVILKKRKKSPPPPIATLPTETPETTPPTV